MKPDYTRYEGHTEGPWLKPQKLDWYLEGGYKAILEDRDLELIADAPLLLARCLELESELTKAKEAEAVAKLAFTVIDADHKELKAELERLNHGLGYDDHISSGSRPDTILVWENPA